MRSPLQEKNGSDGPAFANQDIECSRCSRRIHDFEADSTSCHREHQITVRQQLLIAGAEQDQLRFDFDEYGEIIDGQRLDRHRHPFFKHARGRQRDRVRPYLLANSDFPI